MQSKSGKSVMCLGIEAYLSSQQSLWKSKAFRGSEHDRLLAFANIRQSEY